MWLIRTKSDLKKQLVALCKNLLPDREEVSFKGNFVVFDTVT